MTLEEAIIEKLRDLELLVEPLEDYSSAMLAEIQDEVSASTGDPHEVDNIIEANIDHYVGIVASHGFGGGD